jgi:hypothetical protein
MAVRGVKVLRFAADFPLRRDFLGGDAHAVGDRDIFVFLEDRRIEARLVAAHGHHAHALGAAGDHYVRFAKAYAIGRKRHRLHARGAEAIDRHT